MTKNYTKMFRNKCSLLLLDIILACSCVFFSVSLSSCDDISCPLDSTVECHIGFYTEAVDDGEGNMVPGINIGIGDTLTISAVRPNL